MLRRRPGRVAVIRARAIAGGLLALALLAARPAGAAPASAAEPPLHIAADNVSGTHGPEGDIVLLHGNVRITRERTVLTADAGRYLRTQGLLDLDGNVRMVDSTATVTCDHASYSEHADRLELQGNVVVTDPNGTLRAPAGTYDRRTGRALLTGGVTGQDKNQRLLADQTTYLRDSALVQARGHVRGYDDENRIELEAGSIDFDRARKLAVATEQPVMRATDRDGKVVEMRAAKLRLDTETRIAEAVDSVRVVRDTLQARADHAVFDDLADHGWLTGRPRVWDNETAVQGDSIEVYTDHRVLKRVVVRREAVMDYRGLRATTLGEASRLSGDRVDVYFTREDIDSLVAVGAAHDEYQSAPRAGQTPERNVASGDTITVFFRDRKIARARVEGRAQGEYRLAVADTDTLAARRERVFYDARQIQYVVPQSRIILDQDAHLVYQDLALRSRRVEYDVDRQTLVAEGNPQLVERGDKVTGNLMTYDLESRIGNIYQAETAYERGLYHGDRIRKATDNELDVMNGAYSTCDLPQPHYHFAAHWMKIYLKDKLVAKPVVFYVKNVPLLALPFWIFPIKPGRHSGFLFPQFELGFNNRAGQFIRNAGYYWAPNDYMDLTLSGDYYQTEPSWVIRGESFYKLLYRLDGRVAGTFAHNDATRADNYDLNAEHEQELSPRTRLSARASFVSNRDYKRSSLFGSPLSARVDRFLISSLSLSHNASWASLSAVLDRRQDLDADQVLADPDGFGPLLGPAPGTEASLPSLTSTAPNLSVLFPTRAIGSLPALRATPFARALSSMYFSLNARFLSSSQRTGFVKGFVYEDSSRLDSTTVLGHRDVTRRAAAASTSLTDSRRLFGWLNLAPAVSADGAIYDHDNLGNDFVPTGVWRASLSAGSTFYHTGRTHWGPLVGLRHVISPSVSAVYSPDFGGLTFTDAQGQRQDRFSNVGGIALSGFKTARMNFTLDQRLQVKFQRGTQITRLDNLLSLGISGSYNFLYHEQGQAHPLSTLGSSLRLQPPGLLSADLGWVTDVYSQRPIRSLGYNLGLTLTGRTGRTGAPPALPLERREEPSEVDVSEPWSLGMAYSYSGGYAGLESWSSTQTANGVAHFGLTPNWRLDYSASLDITGRQLVTQRFGLTRDLHCWQATFTRVFVVGGEAEYYFRIGVKEQKEIYLERGTRIGSLGGIQ